MTGRRSRLIALCLVVVLCVGVAASAGVTVLPKPAMKAALGKSRP
jgi:hypothetical protein